MEHEELFVHQVPYLWVKIQKSGGSLEVGIAKDSHHLPAVGPRHSELSLSNGSSKLRDGEVSTGRSISCECHAQLWL